MEHELSREDSRVSVASSREEPDSRQSLHHILTDSNAREEGTPEPGHGDSPDNERSSKKSAAWSQEPGRDNGEEERSVQSDSYSRAADVNPSYTMTVVHSRRNANGTIGSVYSGNKIRHLKKEDGIPLWRKDIQYAFLRSVFEDATPCFTMDGEGTKGHSFADIYINAMARSSKTSKVLREKLLSDRESAQNMAMICLLVNVGRMNTTLNFFPEMRAQLRTYHSIPCLQVHQDANSQYKGLQDAPRLKSILKGSCEDPNQPTSIEKIQTAAVPRTNPVNLVFVLSQYAPKVSESHFFQPRDFFDLVIRGTLSSKSRARAFLWLVWWYLESDFTEEAALNNPFGPGIPGEEPGSPPFKVPAFDHLTEEQANLENVDTEEEQAYGEKMRLVRKRILEEDETVGPPLKKPAGRLGDSLDDRHAPSPARSDLERTRSPSPTTMPPLKMPKPRRLAAARREEDGTPRSDIEGRHATRLILKASKIDRAVGSSSPAPAFLGAKEGNNSTPHARRARPETSHQRAVNLNRRLRIDSILHKKLLKTQRQIRREKRPSVPNRSYVVMKRIIDLPEDYDSEDDAIAWGPGGLVPNTEEGEDYGGEATAQQKIFNRVSRRLAREEARRNPSSALTLELKALQKKKRSEPAAHHYHHNSHHNHHQTATPHSQHREKKLKRAMVKSGRGRRGGRRSQQQQQLHVPAPEPEPEAEPEPEEEVSLLQQEQEQDEPLDDIDMDLLGESRGGGGGGGAADDETQDDSALEDSQDGGDGDNDNDNDETEEEMME